MRDMMITAEEKKEASEHSIVRDEPKYPYGLKIHVDENTYEKLGLSDVPTVGEKYMIIAVAEVCDVHQAKYEGDEAKICMGLQITEMDIKKNKEEKNAADTLYGGDA